MKKGIIKNITSQTSKLVLESLLHQYYDDVPEDIISKADMMKKIKELGITKYEVSGENTQFESYWLVFEKNKIQ